MHKFHLALSVVDIEDSVRDYSERLGCKPTLVIAGEYALWRTESLNFSIRKVADAQAGTLRHLGSVLARVAQHGLARAAAAASRGAHQCVDDAARVLR